MSTHDDLCLEQDRPETDETELRRAEFDKAMTESRDELLEYLLRRARDADVAADLAQETLSRMMMYRDNPDIGDHKLMMYRIAHNLVNEMHRTRRRRRATYHVSLEQVAPIRAEEAGVDEIASARQALDVILKKTLLELPPKCRLAFTLSRFDELSYPQIAAKMGISVKMVEKHISRALLACRAALGDRPL